MFTISGNHGKLTALRCPIAVCSLPLYLIQRFIVLCKTLFKGRITVGSEAPSGKCPRLRSHIGNDMLVPQPLRQLYCHTASWCGFYSCNYWCPFGQFGTSGIRTSELPNFRNVSAALPYKLLFHNFPPTITLAGFTLPPRLSAVSTIQFLLPKTNRE